MKNPFIVKNINDRLKIEVNLAEFYLIWGVFTSFLLASTVGVSCVFTFDCTEFLPTVSYLAAYSHYNRALTWIAAAQSVPLLLFFVSTFVTYSKHLSRLDSYTLLLIGTLFSLLFPSIIVIDEVNSSYYFPFDRLHVILLCSLLLALGIWMLFSLEWLYKIHSTQPDYYIKRLAVYILACFCSVFLSINQWKVSENPEDYFELALKEYLSIGLLTFLPRVYFTGLKQLSVSVSQGRSIKTEE